VSDLIPNDLLIGAGVLLAAVVVMALLWARFTRNDEDD
jgi:hypothetical protein